MLEIFDFPKNKILSSIGLPLIADQDTRFILLPNKIIYIQNNFWISIDQETGNIIDQFIIKGYPIKAASYNLQNGILAILKNEPMVAVSSSVFKTRIAKVSPVDGSVDKFIEISGFEENEKLIDLAVDDNSIFFLTELNNKKRIKQYLVNSKQLVILTDNLNNQVNYDRIKLSGDLLLLLDSLENAYYEVNKFNGRSVASKRQFSTSEIADFNIKFNNLFILPVASDKLYRVSLSPEWAHISLQTNIFELATNGSNQSLIRGTVFNEDETFLPSSPLKIRTLKPLDLLQKYTDQQFISLTSHNTRGDIFIPFLYRTDDDLFMDPDSYWEFILDDTVNIEQIRLKFASFRPGDIRIELLINSQWEILEDLPLPLLFTREDLVFDNFFGKTQVSISGIRVINTTSNTLDFKRLILLDRDTIIAEKQAINYATDTGQTLFFITSPKTTINEVINPRFLQRELFWNFIGQAEVINESLVEGDVGAFLHSLADNQETYVSQKIVLNQAVPRIITPSLYVKGDISYINTVEKNCGFEITIADIDNNYQVYYYPFTTGNYNYRRFYKSIIPPFPIYDLEFKIICQKDTRGSIEIDKVQLEQDQLHNFVDYQIPDIFIKAIYEF